MRATLVALALAALAGCWQRREAPAPLLVDRTSPTLGDPAQPVLLNDALTVYFTDDVRKLSVTPDSVTLLDERGFHVPGQLKTGSNWVSFVPTPPLTPALTDGSFRPGGRYRLQVAGHPRPDAIRAEDGGWLESAVTYDVYVAGLDQAPVGLPSILRPPVSDVPLIARRSEEPLKVAADDPRLVIHFSQPLLPTSVTADAFRVQVLGRTVETLQPRGVRVLTSFFDQAPGSSVELDLGALPRCADGAPRRLVQGDFISAEVRLGGGLTDYAGSPPLTALASTWQVVAGSSVPICEWPDLERGFSDEDGLAPGFEVTRSGVRPLVRVEAGDGSLGVFRPLRDTVLRPGQPFDGGDGEPRVSALGDFCFAAIDVPEGVTVTVDARDVPVRLRATGGVRVRGVLRIEGPSAPLPADRVGSRPVLDLIDAAPVSVVAAGGVAVLGRIESACDLAGGETALLLASASGLELRGALPLQTMLVVEAGGGDEGLIAGARGPSPVYPATFTPGLAPGSDFDVVGVLPWRQLPLDQDAGVLQLGDGRSAVAVDWQATTADPIRGESPDTGAGRVGRWQPARDGDVVVVGGGAFLRLRLRARVRSASGLPEIERLRLVEQR